MNEPTETGIDRRALAEAFARVGVLAGGTFFVQSSLSSLGHVNGSAETVVDAVLDALGPTGLLVVPN